MRESVPSRRPVSASECDAIQAVEGIHPNPLILIRHRCDCCIDRQRGRLRWPDDRASAFQSAMLARGKGFFSALGVFV